MKKKPKNKSIYFSNFAIFFINYNHTSVNNECPGNKCCNILRKKSTS